MKIIKDGCANCAEAVCDSCAPGGDDINFWRWVYFHFEEPRLQFAATSMLPFTSRYWLPGFRVTKHDLYVWVGNWQFHWHY